MEKCQGNRLLYCLKIKWSREIILTLFLLAKNKGDVATSEAAWFETANPYLVIFDLISLYMTREEICSTIRKKSRVHIIKTYILISFSDFGIYEGRI